MRIAKVVVVDRSTNSESAFGGDVLQVFALDEQGAAKLIYPRDEPIGSRHFAVNQITKERIPAINGQRFLLTLLADSGVNSGYCYAYPVDENDKPLRYAIDSKTGKVQLESL